MVGGHRGLFATAPLPAGELLMVAKGLRHPAPRSSGGMASVDVPDLLDLIDALPAEVRAWLLVACQGMHPTEPAEVLSLSLSDILILSQIFSCTAHTVPRASATHRP